MTTVSYKALFTWFVIQIFLILLVLRLDERTRWSWFIVFIPVWFHDTATILSIVVDMVTTCKSLPERNRRIIGRNIWSLTIVILKVVSQILICLKLENPNTSLDLPLYYLLIPVWVALSLTIADIIGTMCRNVNNDY